MPGLKLGVMGGVSSSQTAGTGSVSPPSSATEAAFGPGYTNGGSPSTLNAITPNDPFGIAFIGGLVALGLLLLIRHSLPG